MPREDQVSPVSPQPTLSRRYLAFLGPMLLTSVMQSLAGTVNNAILGQMIGTRALAAATSVFPLMMMMFALLMGMGSGTSVLVGRAFGARNPVRVQQVAGTSFVATLLIGCAVGLAGLLFAGTIMRALSTPASILAPASLYARIVLGAAPVMFAFYLPQAVLRGLGDTRTPMFMILVSSGIGVVATPALVLLGVGVAAAAIALELGMAVSFVWVMFHLRRRAHALAPRAALLRDLRVDRAILGEIFRLGIPGSVTMLVVSAAELVLLGLVNGFGADATAAYGAVNLVISYLQVPAISTAIAASVLAAQAIGARDHDAVIRITRTGLAIVTVLAGGLAIPTYLLETQILRLFITDPHVVAIARRLFDIVGWSMVPFGMAGVFSGVMRASGTVLVPTLLSIAAITLVEVPLAWTLSRSHGLAGIWIAYAATFSSMMLLQGGYFMVWMGARDRALARAPEG